MPALFTKISIESTCSFENAYNFSIDFSSEISQQKGIILSIFCIALRALPEVPTHITFFPLAASIIEIVLPIPLDAPVTSAVLLE